MAAPSHAWVLSHDYQRRLCLVCGREETWCATLRAWALFAPGDECERECEAGPAPLALAPELAPWARYIATLDIDLV